MKIGPQHLTQSVPDFLILLSAMNTHACYGINYYSSTRSSVELMLSDRYCFSGIAKPRPCSSLYRTHFTSPSSSSQAAVCFTPSFFKHLPLFSGCRACMQLINQGNWCMKHALHPFFCWCYHHWRLVTAAIKSAVLVTFMHNALQPRCSVTSTFTNTNLIWLRDVLNWLCHSGIVIQYAVSCVLLKTARLGTSFESSWFILQGFWRCVCVSVSVLTAVPWFVSVL